MRAGQGAGSARRPGARGGAARVGLGVGSVGRVWARRDHQRKLSGSQAALDGVGGRLGVAVEQRVAARGRGLALVRWGLGRALGGLQDLLGVLALGRLRAVCFVCGWVGGWGAGEGQRERGGWGGGEIARALPQGAWPASTDVREAVSVTLIPRRGGVPSLHPLSCCQLESPQHTTQQVVLAIVFGRRSNLPVRWQSSELPPACERRRLQLELGDQGRHVHHRQGERAARPRPRSSGKAATSARPRSSPFPARDRCRPRPSTTPDTLPTCPRPRPPRSC